MRRLTRTGAYVASVTLAVSGLAAAAPAAQADPNTVPAHDAADWLETQLGNGDLLPSQYGGPDVGLSIDGAFTLATVGGNDGRVDDVANAIQSSGTSYLEYEYPFNGSTFAGQSANATAKAMAFFQSLDTPRTTIGTIDLQDRLEALAADAAPIAGRIVDVSTKDGTPDGQDYANTLGQAFAANALDAAGSDEAEAVTDFLLKQQCSSGYFRLGFTADKTAANQSCVQGTDAPDTDATAIAVQQLAPLAGDTAVDAAIEKAQDWLVTQQRCDGSFGGGTSTEGSNTNSTGLAAIALEGLPAARQAATWAAARQVPAAEPAPLVADRGALALNPADLTAARAGGITDAATRDKFIRATAQAAPGLLALDDDPTPALTLAGPTGFVRGGQVIGLTTSGADEGTVLCVTGYKASTRGVSDGSPWRTTVTTAPATANRTYTVTDPYGHRAAATVKVLGKKTLVVRKSSYRVKRAKSVQVTVAGLAAKETATIRYQGVVKATGKAGPGGRFTATFNVGRATGVKRITGQGEFGAIRRGATTIKVVR